MQIYPASPWGNGYIEWFDGTLRREALNAEWCMTTRQAQNRHPLLAQRIQSHPPASDAQNASSGTQKTSRKWPIEMKLDTVRPPFETDRTGMTGRCPRV
ncbi:hypothetical protein [Tropicimonas sp. TH_r6]|uniref:hypothetical protein n=1 Tax=Tropicimonas sp. TH_r6 TaxID=3082085 RepID=UPI0039865C20